MAYDYEFVEVNNAFERITGIKAPYIIGRKASEVLPDKAGIDPHWMEACRDAALKGESREREKFFGLNPDLLCIVN